MATVIETIDNYEIVVRENETLKAQLKELSAKTEAINETEIIETLKAQNKELMAKLNAVGDEAISIAISAKKEIRRSEIEGLKQKKQEVQNKPISEWEKAKLAQAYQYEIEALQAE